MAILRILLLAAYLFPLQTFAEETDFCGETAGENSQIKSTSESAMTTIIGAATEVQTIDSGATLKIAETLKTQIASCASKKAIADGVCLESCSPAIKSFADEWGGTANLVGMIGNSGLIGDKCSKIAQALNMATTALTAYQTACATGKGVCNSSCQSVQPTIQNVSNASMIAVNKAQAVVAASCPASLNCAKATADYTIAQKSMVEIAKALETVSTAGKTASTKCKSYEKMRDTAAAGAVSAIAGMVQAKSCKDQNSNGSVAGLDCTSDKSPNYATPSCQCVRGEKSAAECQAINVSASNIAPGGIALPRPSGISGDNLSSGPIDIGGGDDSTLGKINPGQDGAPPSAGGGGGASAGGGGSGGAGQDGANASKRLNTNILGGGFGGGGGGGSGGGPGYGEMDSKLKDYMPGEKNDPNRTLASQLAKEVTPQAGRSNWEKVRLRYRDNYSSLLNK